MYHGPIIILIIMSSIKELRTDVCLEHYKGPVACRVQYSLSAECACPTENSIIFLLGICKKKKKNSGKLWIWDYMDRYGCRNTFEC